MMTGHRPERSGERVAQQTRDAAFASAGKRKVRRTIVFRHDYLVTEANASGLPRSGSASRLTPY
ncbi:hypothetical protein [Burkholderia pseudomallei]|uniref:hypothetical protein n=1 Tax=Burkholderia pseudomallei TaxID=28450 RepID=UPI000538E5F5|nr:hypothetical protein [Burkholderia pseudomallei]KGV19756.1 hypothetical protein X891_4334 [Burkholderia pseudomallei TSV 43]KGV31499.1 hypothetical protein X893_2999 [Burkholderia pseudomallei TSV 31]